MCCWPSTGIVALSLGRSGVSEMVQLKVEPFLLQRSQMSFNLLRVWASIALHNGWMEEWSQVYHDDAIFKIIPICFMSSGSQSHSSA